MAAAGAVGLAAIVGGASTAQSDPGDQLLPDLRVMRASEVYLVGQRGNQRLRFSSQVENLGAGPLELTQNPAGGDIECNTPNLPEGRVTIQNVYEDSAPPNGFFTRGDDPNFAPLPAGCSRYHPVHDHWHFDNFARYELYRERTGRMVGSSKKVSFCIIDGPETRPGLPGHPNQGYYPQDPANPKFATCSETSTNGLSIGWSDLYGAGLPGQAIRLGGPRGGMFCLVLTVDPGTEPVPDGKLVESNPNNNTTSQRIKIKTRKGRALRVSGACATDLP